MHAEHIGRPPRRSGYGIDVERGRIGGENGAGFADRIQLGENFVLDCHALEHGLDDEIRIARGIEIGRTDVTRAFEASAAVCVMRPFWTAVSRVERTRARPASSAGAWVSIRVTVNPPVAQLIAMPDPIVPAPSTQTRSTGRGAVVTAPRAALGKEKMTERSGLRGDTAFLEVSTRQCERRFERLCDGSLHAADDPFNRSKLARSTRQRLAISGEKFGSGRRSVGNRSIAQAA